MQESPKMESIALIGFLKPSNIENKLNEWVEDAPAGFAQWPEIDRVKGKIKGLEYNSSDNSLEEKTYSFDDYLQKELNEQFWIVASEINDLRLNPTNANTVISDKLFNSTIARLKNKLIERHLALSEKKQLPIAKSLEKLNNFIYRQLGSQIIKNGKPHADISSNTQTLLRQIFKSLHPYLEVSQTNEDLFINFLAGDRNLQSIKWLGTPQELVQLYYILFNKVKHLDKSILTPPKPKYPEFFTFFEIKKNGSRVFYDHKKHNSNPTNGALYLHILNIL